MAGTTSGHPSWDYVLLMAILLVGAGSVMAADPDALQDFCVADLSPTAPLVNGYPCKPSSSVSAEDFVYSGFRKAGDGGGSKWRPPKRSMSMTESNLQQRQDFDLQERRTVLNSDMID